MKTYIAWFEHDGAEDYTIIMADDEDQAAEKFHSTHSEIIIDLHEVA